MSKRRVFLLTIFLFTFSLVGFFLFLFITESGLSFLQQRLNRWSHGSVVIGQANGRLLSEFSLSNIRYSSDNLDLTLQRLEFSWQPVSLLKGELRLRKVVLADVNLVLKDNPQNKNVKPPASTGEPEVIQLPSQLLFFPLILEDFQLTHFKIHDTDDDELLALDRGQVSLQLDSKRLTLKKFDFQGPDLGLDVHGNIEIWQGWKLELLGKWHLAGYGFHPMEGTFSTGGPLRNPHVEVGLHSPGHIRVSGDLVNLLEKPEWTARLEVKDLDLSKWVKYCPKIEVARADGDLHGDFGSYLGEVRADVDWHTLQGMELVTDIVGSGWGIDFTSLNIKNKEGAARAEGGKISWRKVFSWEGHFWFENFDPRFFSEELQGKLNAELINNGDVTEEGNVIANFDIQRLNGLLRDHPIGAVGKVLLLETEVRSDGLTLSSGELAGVARVEEGMFSWGEEPGWAGEISFENFDPSSLFPSFPGSINGMVRGEGTAGEEGVEGWLDIQNIFGSLRNNVISGGGQIALSKDNFQTEGLLLTSGPSKLAIKGRAGEKMGVEFSLVSPDLTTILPDAKGELDLRGSLQGDLQGPELEVTVVGKDLRYKKDHLDLLRGELRATLKSDGRLRGSFQGDGLTAEGFTAARSVIDLTGQLVDHKIEVASRGDWGKFRFSAFGGIDKIGGDWQGKVSGLHLDLADFGYFTQQESVGLTVGADQLQLEKFCLESGEGLACLQGEVQLAEEPAWSVDVKLSAFPLQLLNNLESSLFQADGGLSGYISAKGNTERFISAKGELRAVDGDLQLSVGAGETEDYRVENISLLFQLNEELLKGDCDISLDDGSQLRLLAEVQNAGYFSSELQAMPLTGTLELKDFDLALLSDYTGYGVEPTGWISNSLRLAGTLGWPEIYGDITIGNGGIYLPYQGITLENIVLSIGAAGDSARISGSATSGPGQLVADGILQYGRDGIEADLKIKGNDFLLVDLPEYTIRVNPRVDMKLTRHRGEIVGSIEVPYAQITPEEMSDSISASEDVIVVDGSREERMKGWPCGLDLDVLLGEQVSVEGYGLAGRVGGQLNLSTTQDYTIIGRGELDLIDGTFSVYGRTLSIERGRMLFTGGPIDNPGVDVRAQVKVGDDEARGQGYTVGVDISGLVQNLEYHLFSDPFMEDTEILSLMIVGHSLAGSTKDEENLLEAAAVALGTKGSGRFVQNLGNLIFLDDLHLEGSSNKENVSLVVGKRLTKDLYIGYDFNMFSQIGQFRVRYDLTKGFSVETRSSAESTGADLLFSFER